MSKDNKPLDNEESAPILEEKVQLIDKIMEEAGYGYYQWKTIIVCSLMLFVDGIHMNITNNLFIPLKNSLNVNDTQFAFMSSLLFIGVALGSFASGFSSQNIGRRNTIIISNFLMFGFSLGLAFSIKSYIYFLICRIFIGFLLGLLIPMLFGNLCEFIPIFLRSFTLVSIWTPFAFGMIYTLGLMLIFTPNYDQSGIQPVLIFCSLPLLFCGILFIFILDESPRFLILISNKEVEGIQLIEKISKRILTNEEKNQLLLEIQGGANKDIEVSLKCLFNNYYLKTTIILILLWIIVSYIFYGTMFTLQSVLNKIESGPKNQINAKKVIIDQIIVQLISLPSNLVGGAISEFKIFGRRLAIICFFLFSSIFLICTVIFTKYFSIFYGLSHFGLTASFNVLTGYSSEVYSTKVRDTAIGFFYFWTRMSGFSSQYISVSLESIKFLLQYYTAIVVSFIGGVLTYFLPYETHGNAIDTEFPKETK